jgi:hypothetical protein
MWATFGIIYAAIFLMTLFMTAREHYRTRRTSIFTVIGYLACTIWPVAFAGIFVAAQREGV